MSITENNPVCESSVKALGDYWTMMVVDALSDGPQRFRDLEQKIKNVNTATLTNRLKTMTAQGLISRDEQSRADVTYALTDLGEHVIPVLKAINEFAEYSEKSYSGAERESVNK